VLIEHHKFLVKSLAERQALAERYEAAHPSAGLGPHHRPFNLPEVHFPELHLAPIGRGEVDPLEWDGVHWRRRCRVVKTSQ